MQGNAPFSIATCTFAAAAPCIGSHLSHDCDSCTIIHVSFLKNEFCSLLWVIFPVGQAVDHGCKHINIKSTKEALQSKRCWACSRPEIHCDPGAKTLRRTASTQCGRLVCLLSRHRRFCCVRLPSHLTLSPQPFPSFHWSDKQVFL